MCSNALRILEPGGMDGVLGPEWLTSRHSTSANTVELLQGLTGDSGAVHQSGDGPRMFNWAGILISDTSQNSALRDLDKKQEPWSRGQFNFALGRMTIGLMANPKTMVKIYAHAPRHHKVITVFSSYPLPMY